MADESVAVGDLAGAMAFHLAIAGLLGAALVWLWGGDSYGELAVLMIGSEPYGWAHLAGVRNRWWALAAAVLVGGAAGLAVGAATRSVLAAGWPGFLATLVGYLVGVVPYAKVTQLGSLNRVG